jgi:L-lactate dehydrogenase complex protein LldG
MSRDAILRKIRQALDADESDADRVHAVTERLATPQAHLVPEHARRTGAAMTALFETCLQTQGTDLIPVASRDEIPAAIAAYLHARALPHGVRSGSDPYLAGLPWHSAPELAHQEGPAQASDTAGLSRALAGVAETGTLALASGPDNPVTLAFVPETHIVVLARDRIVGSYEEIAPLLAAELGPGVMPRALNLVTGASRTGDIGGKIVKGAHGPRRLAVILVPGNQHRAGGLTARGNSACSA